MGLLFGNDPNSKLTPELLTQLGAGLLSGNTWNQQLANGALGVNTALATQKQKQLTDTQANKTVQMLQQSSPELAAAVSAGIMTPSDAYSAFLKKQQAAAEDAKPKWQVQNINGHLVRIDPGSGQMSEMGNFEKPKDPEFKQLDDGTYGTFDGTKFNTLGTAQKPTAQTELVRNLEAAGYKQGTPEFQQALMQAMKKPGMSLETDENGNVKFVQGDVQNTPKLTVEQGKNAGFLIRAKNSEKIISDVEKEGTKLFNSTAGRFPGGNYLLSSDAQKYDQAQRDFVNAVLRQESGAVISPEEFNNAKIQYFPQPGDGQDVIEQKRANREAAIEGFKIRAGPGAVDDSNQGQVNQTQTGVKWKVAN